MSFIQKYITSKPLWVNILWALGLVIVVIFLFFTSLSWITGYGHEVKVPSVIGQNADAAKKFLEDRGFDVVIQDSVYVDTVAKLAVTRQLPEADASVKSGRTIYLTINRSIPPQVEMPNLVGFSVKSAELYLQSLGLKMGSTSYEPDIARNAVLKQLLNGEPIAPGTKIPIGSVISFVLGNGEGSGVFKVPDVVGMTLDEARNYLSTLGLGAGNVTGTEEIKDSANSFVVRQLPSVLSDSLDASGVRVPNKIRQGQAIDLFISNSAPPKGPGN